MKDKHGMVERQVAIVTGSATGVGSETALQLSELGWNVVINYTKSGAEAEATSQRCMAAGADVLMVQADVADDASCCKMVADTVDRWGRIDALINNAGTTKFCSYDDLDGIEKKDFLNIYSVNVVGAYQMARSSAGFLKAAKGVVINNASIAGLTGLGSSIAYAASKGAMVTLTLSLAHALGPDVRVNAVCPGFIQGRWTKGYLGNRYDEVLANFEKASTLQRTATPSDVAEAIVYLATKAKLITGEVMIVDGGSTLKQVTLGRQ